MTEVYVLLARLDDWYTSYEYQKSFASEKEMKKFIQSQYEIGDFVHKVDDGDYKFNDNPTLLCYTKQSISRKDNQKSYSLMIHKETI